MTSFKVTCLHLKSKQELIQSGPSSLTKNMKKNYIIAIGKLNKPDKQTVAL